MEIKEAKRKEIKVSLKIKKLMSVNLRGIQRTFLKEIENKRTFRST